MQSSSIFDIYGPSACYEGTDSIKSIRERKDDKYEILTFFSISIDFSIFFKKYYNNNEEL